MRKNTVLAVAALVLVACGLLFFYQLGQRVGQQNALDEMGRESRLRPQRFPATQVDLSGGLSVVLYDGRVSLQLENVRPLADSSTLVIDLNTQVGSGKLRRFADLEVGSAVEHDGLRVKVERVEPSRVTLLLGDPEL